MRLLLLSLLLAASGPLKAADDFLRGSVVKSDKWKMDRARDLEIFEGNVSFRNPKYTLKADNARYNRPAQAWDMQGSVYMLRRFDDKSLVEVNSDQAFYLEAKEEARLKRGTAPIDMKYTGPDGRVLRGKSGAALAENKKGLITFGDFFSLSTDNLDMYSGAGLYDNREGTFLMYRDRPAAVGNRQGYDFAINAERIKFFKDSRDIKFYDKVSGWVKDTPPPAAAERK